MIISEITPTPVKKKFLIFQLGANEKAAMPLEVISEVLPIVTADILSVPEVPSCVLGISNWRGEMIWWVDLEDLLGMKPLVSKATTLAEQMAMVMTIENKSLGLLIRNLIDIELLKLEQMNAPTPGLFPSEIMPFLEGYFLDEKQQVTMSFAPLSLIECPLWRNQALI